MSGEDEISSKNLVKVKNISALFPIGFVRVPTVIARNIGEDLSRPILELLLEDNRTLRLMGIPEEIATEIWALVNHKPYRHPKDNRLTIGELVRELGRVLRVVIYDIIGELSVYVAKVEIEFPDGTRKTFDMIPSHAILIALHSGADIYVAEKLLAFSEPTDTTDTDEESVSIW